MANVKMKKLRIIAMRDQRDGLMRELMRLGCVEIREPDDLMSDPETAALLRPERAGLTAARSRHAELEAALTTLGRYAPEKKKLLAARPLVSQDSFLDDEAMERDYALAREINEREQELRCLAGEETRIRGEIEALTPWRALDMPLESAGTRTCGVSLFSVPAEVRGGRRPAGDRRDAGDPGVRGRAAALLHRHRPEGGPAPHRGRAAPDRQRAGIVPRRDRHCHREHRQPAAAAH